MPDSLPAPQPASDAQRSIRFSMLTSGSLCAVKLAVGLVTGSVGVLAEASNSFLDLIASLFTYFVLRHAEKPADEDHPYGHGKFENIAAVMQGLLILGTGVFVIYRSVMHMRPEHRVGSFSLSIAVMAVSAGASLAIALVLYRAAERTHSLAVRGDAAHFMSDVYSNLGVIAGLAAAAVTGNHLIDPVIGVIVGLIILRGSWDLFARSFDDLTDKEIEPEHKAKIQAILDAHKDRIIDVHELRTRRSGRHKIIDMHVTLCRKLSFPEAHDFIDTLELEIQGAIPYASVLIHPDPCEETCEIVRACNQAAFPRQEETY